MWKVIKSEFFNRQCQNKSGKKLLVEQINRSIIPPNGSVVECFTRDRGAAGFEPHRCHYVVSLSKNINPSLVLVQSRKTCPFINEGLLKGRKESNQTNIPPDILMCVSRGRGGGPHPSPGKSQVIWVSGEIIWRPWKMLDPLWILGKGQFSLL